MKRAKYETLQNIFFVGKRLVADECSRHHVVLAASIVRIITSGWVIATKFTMHRTVGIQWML